MSLSVNFTFLIRTNCGTHLKKKEKHMVNQNRLVVVVVVATTTFTLFQPMKIEILHNRL